MKVELESSLIPPVMPQYRRLMSPLPRPPSCCYLVGVRVALGSDAGTSPQLPSGCSSGFYVRGDEDERDAFIVAA